MRITSDAQPADAPSEALHRSNLAWLYAGRATRSFATAFLTVVFPLYLARLHYSSAKVGMVLTLGSVIGAVMVTGVGLLGDRYGRRPVLIGIGLCSAAGALALAGSANLAVVVVASGVGGIGRGGGAGSGGAFGPFFPAEQPLLAASVSPAERTRAFGRMSFLGGLAAAAGSLVAGVPAWLHGAGLSWPGAYRVVFLLGAVASLAVALVCLPLEEERRPRLVTVAMLPAPAPGQPAQGEGGAGAAPGSPGRPGPAGISTRRLTVLLGLTNALNGFGFGFLGPLLTYWFHVRFGAGPAEIGVLYTLVNLVSALPYLGAHHLTSRVGAVRAVVVTRGIGVLVLLSMAAAPDFLVAGLLLCLRTMTNSLSVPARLSYTMGAAEEHRRGAVAALSTLPSIATASVSPIVGGALMGALVDVPIFGAFLFMGANTIAYYLAFRNAPLPEEAARGRPVPGVAGPVTR